MSIEASAAAGLKGAASETAAEIDVKSRWDALALPQLLVPFHSFLVQHSRERWVVHARAPGCHGEPLAHALRAIAEWQAERGLDPPVRVHSGKERRWSGWRLSRA